MIVVIDYGLGNLFSVEGAIKKLGYVPLISNKIKDIEKADKLILPGVGAFADGMKNLKKLKLIEALNRVVIKDKKPILGICLGGQLMARESYEFGKHKGLGWIDAKVIKLEKTNSNLRIPHVGWSEVYQTKKHFLFKGIPQNSLFYFTHSFHISLKDKKERIGKCKYGEFFDVCFNHKNIFWTQFHPEKSQRHGLKLMENFLKW